MEPLEYTITTLNTLENDIGEFVLFRSRENLERPIFTIILGDRIDNTEIKSKVKSIIDYLMVWISLNIKKISLDLIQTFQSKDIRSDKAYVFNISKTPNIIRDESEILNMNVNVDVYTPMYSYLINSCGPMIFIADKLSDIPVQIRSATHASFILPSENLERVLDGASSFTFNKNLEYNMDSILVFDGMNCENKLSVFKNFFC